jgi:hypothetical protein
MAIEDNLDQLYALYVANHILCMRLWGYMADVAAKAEGIDVAAYIERHRKMSIESADMWKIEGHRNPERLREMIKQSINMSWKAIVSGAPSGSRLQ